jgi:isopentenyl-diphosphate delta-isomerase type 2
MANKELARVAQEERIPVGMGSIRIVLRKPEVIDHFQLKTIAPDVPVLGNIGGVQLRSDDLTPIVELIKRLEVDAIIVHLNPGQEIVQPEGDRDFVGVLNGVRRLCEVSPVPVIAKETGFGIAPPDAAALLDAGARYVDLAGSGGTNWVAVEGYRLEATDRAVADEFSEWGLPTGPLVSAMQDTPDRILASGGLRTGLDVAKAVALGAVAAGMALPFIRAITDGGIPAGREVVTRIRKTLRTAMILAGCTSLDQLRSVPLIQSSQFRDTVESLRELRTKDARRKP